MLVGRARGTCGEKPCASVRHQWDGSAVCERPRERALLNPNQLGHAFVIRKIGTPQTERFRHWLLRYLFRFSCTPISWACSNHEASTLDDYPDFVKSALIEVVRRVTERVLGVEFLSEVLERFV